MILSIDVGSRAIKIVEGVPAGNGVTVRRAATVQTPEGAVKDGNLLMLNDVANVIRTCLANEHFTAKTLNFTVGSTEILHRELTVPRVDHKRLAPIVQNEMYQQLTGGEGYAVDYLPSLEPVPDSPQLQKVTASGMPKEMAKQYLDLTNLLRKKPGSLQMHPSALSKLLRSAVVNDTQLGDQSYIVCEMGAHIVHIYLYSGKTLLFTRCIKAPCDEFFDAMQRLDGFDTIDQVTQGVDLSPEALEQDARIAQASSMLLQYLSQELQRMLQFAISRRLPSPVQTVLLCGGMSMLKGMDAYLASVLDLSVQRIDKLVSVSCPAGIEITPYLNAIGAIARR